MKVYISCHHPDPANELAEALIQAGHTIVSTWHTEPGNRPSTPEAWSAAADRNCQQIETANWLVVVASTEHLAGTARVPGGKFFEAGYAHGLRDERGDLSVQVATFGGVENGMLHTTGVYHATQLDDLLYVIGGGH